MELYGKRVVITGASGGIGSAIAGILDQHGCQLLLVGRDSQRLESLMRSLSGFGHANLKADLVSREGVEKLQTMAESFQADILINALGVNELVLFEDMDAADIEIQLATNLQAPMEVCQALLPQLRRSRGTIVNIGSILGSIGYPGSVLYCATKFGLRGFSEALRRELADTGITVIYFAPRATATELNSASADAMNRELGNAVDSPEWVAEQLLISLQGGKSTNHYLGWPETLFVRINALLPSLVDKAIGKQLAVIKKYCSSEGAA